MHGTVRKCFVPFSGTPIQGPGLDAKYKSEEERAKEEESKQGAKRRKILVSGLGGGLLVGALLSYRSLQTNNKTQISNDSVNKDYLLDEKPPYFRLN